MKETELAIFEKTVKPPTKPLVDAKEIREIARKTLLGEVKKELNKLAESDEKHQSTLEILRQISSSITDLQQTVETMNEEGRQTRQLKHELLTKLKAKLETN